MKPILPILLLSLTFSVCCSSPDRSSLSQESNASLSVKAKQYPEVLEKVFETHGTIEKWNSMRTLSYDMVKPDFKEHQTIDLQSRKVRIEQDKFTIGFDGNDVWVAQKDTNTFTGDARFYHNLYFYFFAMPFVLGDNGIKYESSEALKIDGNTYPGIKITYDDGVGDSSKDNYFLYYNPKTYQVEWLGYTVTYFDGKSSQEIHYLHFENWKLSSELLLPESLTWYNLDLESGEKTVRGSLRFDNVSLSQELVPARYFNKK